MASSKANLSSLPAELLLSILWYSRELSLINVCQEFRACLPPFSPLARSLAVLAFSKVNQVSASPDGRNYQGPITESFLQGFHSVLDERMNLSIPLSLEQHAHLQHDVLCSGWWNINRFHAVHLFLFRHHLLSLEARLSEAPFWMSAAQSDSFKQYIRDFETHWSLWTADRATIGAPYFPPIIPWKSMPSYSLNTSARLTQPLISPTPVHNVVSVENTLVTMSQHAFMFQQLWHGPEYWNVMRVNDSEPNELSRPYFAQPPQLSGDSLENMKADVKGRKYSMPPRPLLTPPFTTKKRGVLVYLIQEAAGRCFITDTPYLNHGSTRQEDEKTLHNAILEAIPLGDVPFLKILLVLLHGRNPPHLSPDQSYTGALIAPVAGSKDRAMVGLYVQKASWSRGNMDQYVLAAMRSANLEALSVLLDLYAVYDRHVAAIERFERRMLHLLGQSQLLEDASQARLRNIVATKIKAMKAAFRGSEYMPDQWVVEQVAK